MSAKTFTSEEERAKALDAIPELPPDGKTPAQWAEELQGQIDEILSAPIGEASQDPAAAAAAAADVAAADPAVIAEAERQASFEAERARIKAAHDVEMDQLRQELAAAKAAAPAAGKTATELAYDAMQDEANLLEAALEKVDDPLDDPDYTSNMRRLTLLNRKLSRAQEAVYAERDKMRVAELDKAKADMEAARVKAIKDKEAKEVADRAVSDLEEFRKGKKELQSGQPFIKDGEEFTQFSQQVAQAYWGDVKPDAYDKIEIAMIKYREGVPSLMDKIREKNLRAPKGLTQYMTISEVDMLMKGWRLNASTGKWEPLVNKAGVRVSFPDHDAAYDYMRRTSGKSAKDALESERRGAAAYADAVSGRAKPVELDESARNSMADINLPMEDLLKLYETFDVQEMSLLYSQDPNAPKLKQFDQVALKLGFDTAKEMFS